MYKYFLIYEVAVSIIAIVITLYDKKAAKKHPRHRVRERSLILFAVLGGAVAEYFTMLAIRHKTRHKKFMIGLPVIIILHIIAVAAVIFIKSGVIPV